MLLDLGTSIEYIFCIFLLRKTLKISIKKHGGNYFLAIVVTTLKSLNKEVNIGYVN